MATERSPEAIDAAARDERQRAAQHRREVDLKLSMSERLAALHHLCLQAAQVRGAAKRG
jgi:hypothetical protein